MHKTLPNPTNKNITGVIAFISPGHLPCYKKNKTLYTRKEMLKWKNKLMKICQLTYKITNQ